METVALHADLWSISRLFSYPDAQMVSAPLPEGVGAEAVALLEEINGVDTIPVENEYVRLFINAMPEVPCAPYGSVYLEGSVMGESTLKIATIYRKYGIEPAELADHIAVESEFLAWLHGRATVDTEARKDFDYLLNHLRKWSDSFFAQVAVHDQIGCYRRASELARALLLKMA